MDDTNELVTDLERFREVAVTMANQASLYMWLTGYGKWTHTLSNSL
jgi:hypothetical protein